MDTQETAVKKPVVYICGKVTGEPIHKVTMKFGDAQMKLQKAGFEAINPLAVVNDWHCSWNTAMRKCIAAMMQADALYCLPDVEHSKGAAIEINLATKLDIPKFVTIDGLKTEFLNEN